MEGGLIQVLLYKCTFTPCTHIYRDLYILWNLPFWEKSRLWSNRGLRWNGRTLKLVLRAMLDSIAPQRCVQTLAGAEKNRLWGLDFVSLDNFLLVLLNFGCGYLARISNTKLNLNIWRRKSSNSNQFYTLNKAFLSQHTPYRCTWKYGFDNIDSQYLWLLPTRGRYFMMLANGARGALFWRASHLEEK